MRRIPHGLQRTCAPGNLSRDPVCQRGCAAPRDRRMPSARRVPIGFSVPELTGPHVSVLRHERLMYLCPREVTDGALEADTRQAIDVCITPSVPKLGLHSFNGLQVRDVGVGPNAPRFRAGQGPLAGAHLVMSRPTRLALFAIASVAGGDAVPTEAAEAI